MKNLSSVKWATNRVRAAHRLLEEKIAKESTRPLPDFTLIAKLKRRKLAAKDALLRIQSAAPARRKANA